MAAPASGLLILVPARGGSKGLPGKNARRLGDRPLLAWTAAQVAAAALPGRAVLSTDDPALAEAGRAAGLEVPFLRPAELATDTAGMLEVVEHAVGALEARDGAWVERVMLLQPTCPFRSPALLRGALDLLERPGTEGVIGVTAIERSLSVMYREDNDGLLTALATWDDRTRRQDVRPLLTPNGTMYLVRRDALRAHRRLFPPRLRSVRTTRLEAIDIDTPDDWALAEAVVAAGLAAPCA